MAESSSSEGMYAPKQKTSAITNSIASEGKQASIAKPLEISIKKENGAQNIPNFKNVPGKSPTEIEHSYSAIPSHVPHSPLSADKKIPCNVYCIVCYRIMIHILLLYCVCGVTYLLIFQQKTSPFYTDNNDNGFAKWTKTYEPTVQPTAAPQTTINIDFVETTNRPSTHPSFAPTSDPSVEPTFVPTSDPSVEPTFEPNPPPSSQPSIAPTFNFLAFTVGDYKLSAQNVSHNDWLLCDGSEVLITDYPLLYSLIATSFGVSSNQSLFYKLPNATNKVIASVSNQDAHYMGDVVGSETDTITLSESQLPAHSHFLVNGGTSSTGKCSWGRAGDSAIDLLHPYLASYCLNGDYTSGNAGSDYGLARTDVAPNIMSSGSVGESKPIDIMRMQPTIYAGNLFIYAQ